jgi:hypothetical protein
MNFIPKGRVSQIPHCSLGYQSPLEYLSGALPPNPRSLMLLGAAEAEKERQGSAIPAPSPAPPPQRPILKRGQDHKLCEYSVVAPAGWPSSCPLPSQ